MFLKVEVYYLGLLLFYNCTVFHFECLRLFSFLFNFTTQETESGHGIMEEPELTLVSTSDVSIAEVDFANLTLGDRKENEAESFQVIHLI